MNDDDPADIGEDEIDPDLFQAIANQATVSAAQPRSRSQLAADARAIREQREFWTAILATEIGRREVWKMLNAGHPFAAIFATTGALDTPNPLATWYERGVQELALRWYRTLQGIDPHGVMLMQSEYDFVKAKSRRKQKAAE